MDVGTFRLDICFIYHKENKESNISEKMVELKKMYKTFCFIFAREGSKRIPNKNLQKINNRSLLQITIDLAKKINEIR